MKKILLTSLIFILAQQLVTAKINYDELYFQTELINVKFMHNIDPYQDEDYLKYTWSPYPLFRTSSPLYFKSITVEPGYYLVTPRNLNGADCVLFKENGRITHIVPVVKKDTVPAAFYQTKVPMPKQTKFEKFITATKKTFYKTAKDSQKVPPPSAFIETLQEGNFFLIKYYFGNYCYWLLFKKDNY